MEIITVYGKKASAIRADGDIDYKKSYTQQNFSADSQQSRRRIRDEYSSSDFAYGIRGYSPKAASKKEKRTGSGLFGSISNFFDGMAFSVHNLTNKNTIRSYYSPEKSKAKFDYAFSGMQNFSQPKSQVAVKKADRRAGLDAFAVRFLHLVAFSAICLVVPYYIFNFLNNIVDDRDFTGLSEWTASESVPTVTVTDADSGETITKDLETLESLFGAKIVDAENSLAFSFEKNDIIFDSEGNLIMDGGEIEAEETYTIGEPVTYSVYKVKSGDTVETISRKFGLRTLDTIIAVNEIKNVRSIKAGQKLTIPSQDGIIHKIASGDSLLSLSVKYHVPMEDILDVNDISSSILSIGQKIFIPGAKLDKDALLDAMGERFRSPITVGWRLTSHFGPRTDPISGVASNHTGIDMACPKGTPIKAAMSGTVLKAGWSNIYGNYVLMKHPGGYQTLYGHMTRYVVKQGQSVDQSVCIGYVGSTGYSTGPHLHFTVYKSGKRIDPLPLIKK
ncbi:MAG: M23 family metallopeptidase [Treponema sp.]|nr:M23 family metallopeptidase [Treponema sp.]